MIAKHSWSESIAFGSATKTPGAPEVCYSVFPPHVCLVRHGAEQRARRLKLVWRYAHSEFTWNTAPMAPGNRPLLTDTLLGFFDFIGGRIWTLWMAIHAGGDTSLPNYTAPHVIPIRQICRDRRWQIVTIILKQSDPQCAVQSSRCPY